MASILFHLYFSRKKTKKIASGAPKNKNIPYISIWIIFPWLRNMVPYSPVISPVIDSPVMVDFPGGKSLQVARNSFFSTFRVNHMYNSRYWIPMINILHIYIYIYIYTYPDISWCFPMPYISSSNHLVPGTGMEGIFWPRFRMPRFQRKRSSLMAFLGPWVPMPGDVCWLTPINHGWATFKTINQMFIDPKTLQNQMFIMFNY